MRESCRHCTLPLGGRVVASEIDGELHRFCCYGCLLAYQVTGASGEEGAASTIVIRLGLAIFLAMNVMMMSMPGYAPHIYGGDAAIFDGPLNQVLRWLAMIFALPVLLLLGWPIVRSFVVGGWSGGPAADALVLIAVAAAFGLSIDRTVAGTGAIYFDTAVMVLLFVTLGRYLEARARADAGHAIRADLTGRPTRSRRIVAGRVVDTAVDELKAGDVVRVHAGDMFPTDGIVVSGRGWVDEALMTGESRLIARRPGSRVAGGTCSADGSFDVRVVRPAAASAAARIEQLLDAARMTRSPLERWAERFAQVFLPATVAIAAAAGLWHGWYRGADSGILVSLSVLVVACPCALGIATPVALWFGVVAAARRGVILRDAGVLERADRVDRVYFDKTGTLTHRTPRLVHCRPLPGCRWSADGLLRRVAALEQGQNHPIARAVVGAAGGEVELPVRDVAVDPGRGIRGRVDAANLAVGTEWYGDVESIPSDWREQSSDVGRVFVWEGRRCIGVLTFAEEPRSDAVEALRELRVAMALSVGVLSGDSSARAATSLAVDGVALEVGLSPADKLERIQDAVRQSRTAGGAVLYVGDGVNDAPALAAADVGVAFGEPADLPRTAADALCVGDAVSAVPWLLRHSRRVVRVVRQNLGIAFGYNTVAVGFAAAGLLDPLIAAAAMLGSSLLVVANARRAGSSDRETRVPESRPVTKPPADDSPHEDVPQASWMPSSSNLR